MINRALISVSNKTHLIPFAKALTDLHIEILATGGTATWLTQHNIPVTEVSDYTGFPEILDGRVKTLHPKILGGILARRGLDDATLKTHDINPIDLVIVNLYPFEQNKHIEYIDIGGPTLIRSAAKNHEHVTVVIDPTDYDLVLSEIIEHRDTTLATRRALTHKAFSHTAHYDSMIADYFSTAHDTTLLPTRFHPDYQHIASLRYGENPQQAAGFYRKASSDTALNGTLANAQLLQGKPLSYNNLIDADAALRCVQSLSEELNACAIIKHATPCGVAQATSLHEAYKKAFATDPTSAFGGIIALNKSLDAETARHIISEQFVEVIIAPDITQDAQVLLASKKNVRVLAAGFPQKQKADYCLHSVSGGLLIQTADTHLLLQANDYRVVSKRQPTQIELNELLFAWQVVQFVKSNAIVYTNHQQTLGIGAGQTSRVFSAKIAALKAAEAGFSLRDAVMASDAFFPFSDSIEIAAKAGVTAIIQPGGSMRDNEVIAMADQFNLVMIMTGVRHFLH